MGGGGDCRGRRGGVAAKEAEGKRLHFASPRSVSQVG